MKPESADNEIKMNIFQKLWRHRKYFIIEPMILCWVLPSCFMYIGIQNLGLEKACRVSLGYRQDICANVLENPIDCEEELGDDKNETDARITMISRDDLVAWSSDYNFTVCVAERDTQKEIAYINGIRGPLSAIFPIIVILFAGGWSDRKGIRKPCMIFPLIGEALSIAALLISSIFFDAIPMEFGTIAEKVLPAMLGGSTLMTMGIFSYLTAATPEEDRTFRFGIFGTFANIMPIIGLPLAGTFYTNLGYVKLFILGLVFFILGVLYLIFFVDEIKLPEDPTNAAKVEGGQDNYGFELTSTDVSGTGQVTKTNIKVTEIAPKKKKNAIAEFFDPSLAYACIEVFIRKREKNRRTYLILLVLAYALFLGPTLGEIDYLYPFALIRLKWDGEQYSLYSTYSTAIVTVGTFLMTGVFSKIFKMSDSMVGMLSALCTAISRPMFAFSKESILFYAAGTIDMFVSVKTIAIKTIISTMVVTEEIGRVYSVLGISDAIGGFIFPPIYSYVYLSTLETFPGAFYLFGEIFFIPNVLLFGATYFLLRNERKAEEKSAANNDLDEDKVQEITHI